MLDCKSASVLTARLCHTHRPLGLVSSTLNNIDSEVGVYNTNSDVKSNNFERLKKEGGTILK